MSNNRRFDVSDIETVVKEISEHYKFLVCVDRTGQHLEFEYPVTQFIKAFIRYRLQEIVASRSSHLLESHITFRLVSDDMFHDCVILQNTIHHVR